MATYGDIRVTEASAAAESILLRDMPSAVARREHADSRVLVRRERPEGNAAGEKASAASSAHRPATRTHDHQWFAHRAYITAVTFTQQAALAYHRDGKSRALAQDRRG